MSAWKERGLRRLAAAAAEITVDVVEAGSAPVTAVPADPERGPVRGHHPAGALAAEVARLWGVPCLALLRRSASRRQRGLRVAERRANVRGVFESDLSPPRVTLVDDVYTSGSTVAAAASALRRAGAREVEVLTFARAVRGYSVV